MLFGLYAGLGGSREPLKDFEEENNMIGYIVENISVEALWGTPREKRHGW
jgi:hypothetical protein